MKWWIYLTILLILITFLFAGCFKSSSRPPKNDITIDKTPKEFEFERSHEHEEDIGEEFWLEPLAEPGPPWYKTDLHTHGVVSADGHVDLGILSQAAKTYGYNALFLTDHNQASSFPINNFTANFMQFNDSYTRWDIETFGSPSSSTNELVTSPVDAGTASLHLKSSSSAYAESFVYTKRGPNFRAGDITLDVAIYPTQLDTDSSIYISVSIGGDATAKTPHGYTTTDGAINSGKSTVLVWQIGNGVVPSSDPNARVITYDLDDPIYGNGPHTLNAWNHYTINVTDALTDIPTADQPLDYNALSYPKMAVASNNGGTTEAYFDTYTLQAPGETPAAEYIYRTSLISNYDTSTFKIFPSIEMGVSKHVNRFNFGITTAGEFVDYDKGIDGIPTTQATGYPAQLNHPAQPGGVTYAEAVDNQAFNAEIMEVRREVHIDLWDDILMQDVQVLGAANTDKHAASYSGGSNATYIYSSALDFDLLLRSLFEGRTYSVQSFTGPMVFNLDPSSSEPYPARYPVFVSDAQATANVSVSIPTGASSGYTMKWISEDTLVATDTLTGPSFDKTRAISLAGSSTYVRTELRSSGDSMRGLSQPIFFVDVTGLPTDKNIHVEGVTTSNGQGYIKDNVKGITNVAWDESNPNQREMTLTLSNPSSALVEMRGSSGDEPIGVEVDSSQISPESSLNNFNLATGTAWFYDNSTQTVYLKVLHAGAAASALITFGPPDTTPPTAPTNLTATVINPNQVDLSWTASTDNVFVMGYEVFRDNSLLEAIGNVTSYSDNSVQANTNYDYEVRAVDASGNLSSFSNVAQATTPPATSLTFNPIHDANVRDDNPNTNYGSSTVIQVDNSPAKHILMTFNVAGTNQVFKATLRLYNVNESSSGGDFYQVVNPSWDESTVTWNNAPSEEPTLLASLGEVDPNNWYEVDVTSIVTGNGLVGIKMTSTATNGAYYTSKEGATGFAPELVLSFEGVGVNNPPVADNQSVTTTEGMPVTVTLTGSDPDSDCPLTFSIVSQPANGNLGSINNEQCNLGNGSAEVLYTPDTNFTGSDSFTFEIADPISASSNTATVSITVDPSSGTLTFTPTEDAFVRESSPTSNYGSSSLLQVDGSPVNHSLITFNVTGVGSNQIANATLRLYNENFSPAGGNFYQINNPSWDEGTVTWNNAPNEDSTLLASLGTVSPGNWYNVDLTSIVTGDGLVSVKAISTHVDGAYYSSKEGSFSPELVVNLVNGNNNPPAADNQSVTTNENTPITITLTGSDPDGDCPLTFSVSQPSNGSLGSVTNQQCTSSNGSADVVYTPDTDFSGSDNFTFNISDPAGASSNTATVSITVDPSSGTLTFTPTEDAFVRESSPTSNYGSSSLLQVDGSPVNHSLITFNVIGVGSNQIANATLRLYNENFSPVGGNFYQINNPSWDEGTVTWNNAPNEDSTLLASLGTVSPGNWYNVDLTSIVTGDGLVSVKAISTHVDGAYYSSKEGSFSPELVVNLVNGSNSPPVAGNQSVTTNENTPITIILTGSDPDGDCPLTFSVSQPSNGSLGSVTNQQCASGDGSVDVVYAPDTDFSGSDNFTFNISDPAGASSNIATVSITVDPSSGTLTFTPIDDAYVRESSPTSNYGDSSLLRVDGVSAKHSLITFNVTGVGSNQIANATLRLHNLNSSPEGGDFYQINNPSWNEGTVTWENAPSEEPTLLASLGQVISGNWYEVDLTNIVVGDGLISFKIISISPDGASYTSKEDSSGFIPELIITIAP